MKIVAFGFTPPYTPTFHTLSLQDKQGCTTKGCTNPNLPGTNVCYHCLRRGSLKMTSTNMLQPAPTG